MRTRSEEHTSELQSLRHLVCRLLHHTSLDPPSLHDALPIWTSSSACNDGHTRIATTTAAATAWRRAALLMKPAERSIESNVHARSRHRRGRHQNGVSARGCARDRKSTRLNSSHLGISYAVFCTTPVSTLLPYTTLFRSGLRPRRATTGTRGSPPRRQRRPHGDERRCS